MDVWSGLSTIVPMHLQNNYYYQCVSWICLEEMKFYSCSLG